MSTDWLAADFQSDFEQCKDQALKDALMTHGQWVTFKYKDQHPDERIFAVFERAPIEINLDADVALTTQDPTVEVRYADFDNVANVGDQVEVVEVFGAEEVTLTLLFNIVDRNEPDEQGGILFTLEFESGTRSNTNP